MRTPNTNGSKLTKRPPTLEEQLDRMIKDAKSTPSTGDPLAEIEHLVAEALKLEDQG